MELISSTKEQLLEWYKAKGYEGPLSTTLIVADEVEKAESAEKLAKQARAAIGKFVSAHEELSKKLESKMTLPNAIETVQVFVAEVSSAKKLHDKLDKK